MTTGETQSTMAYQAVVGNLLALRDEAREANHEDIKAITSILASVMSVQLIDRFSRIPVPGSSKSKEPVLVSALKESPTSLTDNPWTVPRLAQVVSN